MVTMAFNLFDLQNFFLTFGCKFINSRTFRNTIQNYQCLNVEMVNQCIQACPIIGGYLHNIKSTTRGCAPLCLLRPKFSVPCRVPDCCRPCVRRCRPRTCLLRHCCSASRLPAHCSPAFRLYCPRYNFCRTTCSPMPLPLLPCPPCIIPAPLRAYPVETFCLRRKLVQPYCNKTPRCCRSIEIIGGKILRCCDCDKYNGLQGECERTGCRGNPRCLTRPATCNPSRFANAKHLGKKFCWYKSVNPPLRCAPCGPCAGPCGLCSPCPAFRPVVPCMPHVFCFPRPVPCVQFHHCGPCTPCGPFFESGHARVFKTR